MRDERLEFLIHGYLDGSLSSNEVQELDSRICTEPAARKRFWEVARIHGELRVWGERKAAVGQANMTLEQMFPETSTEAQTDVGSQGRPWGRWTIGVAAAAAFVLAGMGIGRLIPNRQPGIGAVAVVAPSAQVQGRPLGWVIAQSRAVYAEGRGPGKEGAFKAGLCEMLEGMAHVRLENGVDLTLQGPVLFELHDVMRVTLKSGALRALVPEGAHGFTIEAPEARFEDLGTEFGVEVNADGRSALRVFDGEVRVKASKDEKALALVQFGSSVEVKGNELRSVQPLADRLFPSSDRVAFERWKQEVERLKGDPTLLSYYTFESDSNTPARLVDVATNGLHTDGEIVGANWVTGRWPGKMALQFENPGDAVRLSLPGEYEDLTVVAVVRVDRLDQSLSAVLNTSGWQEGGLHWQINRSGTMTSSGVFGKRPVLRGPAGRVPLGKWVALAMVLDAKTQEMRYYADGQLIGCKHWDGPQFVASLKKACLGRLEEWAPEDHREFRGRMDEVAIWKRVLSDEELGNFSQMGAAGAFRKQASIR
ncbi:MAG: LamG-like jellyroll fold domain-containing protein [Verrucomicrobiota bacterium]